MVNVLYFSLGFGIGAIVGALALFTVLMAIVDSWK